MLQRKQKQLRARLREEKVSKTKHPIRPLKRRTQKAV